LGGWEQKKKKEEKKAIKIQARRAPCVRTDCALAAARDIHRSSDQSFQQAAEPGM
jgi:hypothetical protein